jgi:hypothetical protein
MVSSLAGRWKPIVMTKIFLLAISILASSLAAARPARALPGDEDDRHAAVPGVTMMMDGDLDGAVAVFQQIEQKDPDSPVGYVLEADANKMVPNHFPYLSSGTQANRAFRHHSPRPSMLPGVLLPS